eukprot:1714016-Prymnesium_polylepis.1
MRPEGSTNWSGKRAWKRANLNGFGCVTGMLGWAGAKIEILSATPEDLGRMCDAGGDFGGYYAREGALQVLHGET